jgi:hypothetical protein
MIFLMPFSILMWETRTLDPGEPGLPGPALHNIRLATCFRRIDSNDLHLHMLKALCGNGSCSTTG